MFYQFQVSHTEGPDPRTRDSVLGRTPALLALDERCSCEWLCWGLVRASPTQYPVRLGHPVLLLYLTLREESTVMISMRKVTSPLHIPGALKGQVTATGTSTRLEGREPSALMLECDLSNPLAETRAASAQRL